MYNKQSKNEWFATENSWSDIDCKKKIDCNWKLLWVAFKNDLFYEKQWTIGPEIICNKHEYYYMRNCKTIYGDSDKFKWIKSKRSYLKWMWQFLAWINSSK